VTAFPKIIGKWLFDINIFACLTGPDGGEGVPVIGRGDHHRVDGLVVHNSAEVSMGSDFFAPILEGLGFAVQVRLIHIA
jgi:hypothetical protein